MINNDIKNQLNRYFNNPAASGDTGGAAAELYKKIKSRQDAIQGKPAEGEQAEAEKAAANPAKDTATLSHFGRGILRNASTKDKAKTDADAKTKPDAKDKSDANLSPEERRQKELKAILDKINAEEAARKQARTPAKSEAEKTDDSSVITTENPEDLQGKAGFLGFLNDMPLFNEFKTGLMDAFKMLDSATAGSISAQYELNYSTMQYVANAAGGFDYKEVNFSMKLDLNYVKAAAGGKTGSAIADAIGSSDDFASLIENLKNATAGQAGQAQAKKINPQDLMASMKDYFSPEKTAGRILDFSTAFFPNSSAFKAKGDTPEAREEFAQLMRDAIQKGFDQAQGILGKVPKATQDGIDKTHDLVFKGIDDFVKNGLNKNKQDQGVYSALEQFAFSAQFSYSEKTVSVRSGTYDSSGNSQANQQKTQSALDTQA